MARLTPAAAALLCAAALRASAQLPATPPIDTDRPDFTDGTATVTRGRVQLETGYTFARGRDWQDLPRTHSFPEALLRIGIARHAEIRVGQNFLDSEADGAGATGRRGRDDLSLGTKLGLAEQHGTRPALSVEASTTLPTGSDALSAHRALPGAALLLGWETSGPWSAGMEFAGTRRAGDYLQLAASLSLQYTLTRHAQVYGEWFTFQPVGTQRDASAEHYANSGVLVLLSNNVQVDARVGVGLNPGADKYFLGAGFAIRR